MADQKPGAGGPWWKDGVAIFGEVTGWIVVPIVAALYAGRWLDSRYGTGNLYFLGLTAIAFIISCVGIALIGTRYMKKIEEEEKKKKNDGTGTTN